MRISDWSSDVCSSDLLTFELRDGQFLSLKHAIWPFVGGTLTLRPTLLNLKVPEERRYVIEIVGADAAQFVQQMDLGNISATGTFDGSLPLVRSEERGVGKEGVSKGRSWWSPNL